MQLESYSDAVTQPEMRRLPLCSPERMTRHNQISKTNTRGRGAFFLPESPLTRFLLVSGKAPENVTGFSGLAEGGKHQPTWGGGLICKAVIIRDEEIVLTFSWEAALESHLGIVEDLPWEEHVPRKPHSHRSC